MRQQTLTKSITCSGIGLHKGEKVSLTLHPAPVDTGIKITLASGGSPVTFSPRADSVADTSLATTLVAKGRMVATVEHLMAAIRGMGVDNIHIEVGGNELPIMDGSAASFVYLIRSAGLARQKARRRVLRVARSFSFGENGKSVSVVPYDGFFVDCIIDFPHPCIGRQRYAMEVTPDAFASEISKARTFGFLRDVEFLRKNGLALGGSLDNAVVLDECEVINAEGLRYGDEFVRHKLLDFIGDMALAPLPLLGRFSVRCSGHALNNAFLKAMADEPGLLREAVLTEEASRNAIRDESVSERLAPVMAGA